MPGRLGIMPLNAVSATPREVDRFATSTCFECHSWLKDDGACPVCAEAATETLPSPRSRPEPQDHTCPECSAVPPFAARVCPYCGYRFEERVLLTQDRRTESVNGYRCGRCKSPLIEGARFCATCGREFTETGPDSPFFVDGILPANGYSLEQSRKQMLVNTFIQGSGFVVLAASIVFVVVLCFR